MMDYRIEAATKEEWAERALRAEAKLAYTAIDYEKLRRRWAEVAQSRYQRAKSAEAKLAKAVEALEKLARLGNGDHYGNSDGNMVARATLAELKGQDDE
jgi:hypothetical protein